MVLARIQPKFHLCDSNRDDNKWCLTYTSLSNSYLRGYKLKKLPEKQTLSKWKKGSCFNQTEDRETSQRETPQSRSQAGQQIWNLFCSAGMQFRLHNAPGKTYDWVLTVPASCRGENLGGPTRRYGSAYQQHRNEFWDRMRNQGSQKSESLATAHRQLGPGLNRSLSQWRQLKSVFLPVGEFWRAVRTGPPPEPAAGSELLYFLPITGLFLR